MKSFRKARVEWVTDEYLPDPRFKSGFKADVFVNGSAAVINVGDERVDRLLFVTTQERKDGKDEVLEISGRSEYLRNMKLHPDEQTVTVRVKGAKCLTC